MNRDSIVEEIHKFRETHARKFHYDLNAIFADLRRKQSKRGNMADLKPVKRAVSCVAEECAVYRSKSRKK